MKLSEKLKILEEILFFINTTTSTENLLDFLIDKCIAITGAVSGSIALINPETKYLEIQAARGLSSEKIKGLKLKEGEGITGEVIAYSKLFIVHDAEEEEAYIRIRDDLMSELAAPLIIEKETIGVISVDSNRKYAFNDTHAEMLSAISQFASQILERSKIIRSLKTKINQQKLLLEISSILDEEGDLKNLFDKVMKTISAHIHIKRGMLVLFEKKDLKIFAAYKISDEAMKRGVYQIGEGIIGKVYKKGRAISIKKISENKTFLNRLRIRRKRWENNSFFAFPVSYEKKLMGVLSLEKNYLGTEDFKNTKELMPLICSLISNKVHTYTAKKTEKERLLRKNRILKAKINGIEPPAQSFNTNNGGENPKPLQDVIRENVKNFKPGEIYDKILEETEKAMFEWALIETNYNQRRAAELLGVHRNTLAYKVKSIDEGDY